uniref:Uncharacterized protein n=1 Tax=Anopheles epiroticus TaxID=199890 RepID=A0A182PZ81_9DIPT
MLRFTPQDSKAVLPLARRMLRLSGFLQETERFGMINFFNLFIFLATVLVPKVCFPYPNTAAMIQGISELIYFTNVYVGYFLLVLEHRHYRELLSEIDTFVKVVCRPCHHTATHAEQTLVKLNLKIQKISALFCCYILITVIMYWSAPCLMTYHSVYKARMSAGNKTLHSPIQYYPNLEESFYWLNNRDTLFGYAVFSGVAIVICGVASYNNATKLLTILPTIKYCSTLLQLVTVRIDDLSGTPPDKNIEQELKNVVQLHQLAIRCVTLLDQTLSYVMALQLALCILTWCFTLLCILIVGYDVSALNGLLIMINITLEMFSYCFFCNELSTISEIVSRQSYEFQWEKCSPTVRKLLTMVILRGQRPLHIRAGGVITVDLDLFTKVVKTSYSVLVVLKDLV